MDLELDSEIIVRRASPMMALIVDDDLGIREICTRIALDAGLEALSAENTDRALALLGEHPIDIVLSDLKVPPTGGMDLLKRIRSSSQHVAVMMLTQYGTIESAVEATQLGARDYITKPFHIDELQNKLTRLVRELELDQENLLLREQLRSGAIFSGLIGASVKMQAVYRMIQRVSQHTYPVLILGESGTGKELVARSIHFSGPRKHKPFIPVDCSSLVSTLIESELFGYAKGAFTGANHRKTGLLEAAQEGTLFLDEVGDMPVGLQTKLLRVLQEREVRPVGSADRIPINARVIAATNRNLEIALREGHFRQDLYFRLNVVQINLPPLRERKTDIPLIARSFLDKFFEHECPAPTIPEDVMTHLMAYNWPGNVRELENLIQRAVALGSSDDLYFEGWPSSAQREPDEDKLLPFQELQRRAIVRALEQTHGDKINAARLLGIAKTTLYRKLKDINHTSRGSSG